MAFLLTMRGIPQIYYATEILGTGNASPSHGNIRKDFPGGWNGDPINKFTNDGRDHREKVIWNHLSSLAKFRKTSSALTTGKMMQFVPEDGLYVFFRYDNKQTVMTVMHTGKTKKTVNMKRFEERTAGFSKMRNIFTHNSTSIADFEMEPYNSHVFELTR